MSQDVTSPVLLRKCKRPLDDAAREVGGDRFTSADRQAPAEVLDKSAGAEDPRRTTRNRIQGHRA